MCYCTLNRENGDREFISLTSDTYYIMDSTVIKLHWKHKLLTIFDQTNWLVNFTFTSHSSSSSSIQI